MASHCIALHRIPLTCHDPAQRAELLAFAVACGGSAAQTDVVKKAKSLLTALTDKAILRGIPIPEDLAPPEEAPEEASAEPAEEELSEGGAAE